MFRTFGQRTLPLSRVRGRIIPYPPPLEAVSIRLQHLLFSLGDNQPHDIYFTEVILEINMNIMAIIVVAK